MKFINSGEKSIEVRIGKRFNFSWINIRPGEEIDLPEEKGKRYGLEGYKKLQNVTEGKIGNKKVETKQFEKNFKIELEDIKGIGKKTAKDIYHVFRNKEQLIKAIKLKEQLPFRDDVEKKLRKKYGK